MTRDVRVIDSYTAGELAKLNVQLYATEVDLTGFTVDYRLERDGVDVVTTGSVAWLDDAKGQIQVTFAAGDLDVTDGETRSRHKLEVWAGNGIDERVASLLILFDVYQHVGAVTPTV